MQLFARIAVNVPSVTGIFDYALPAGLAGVIGVGHLVTVPFGRQTVQGVVLELASQSSVPETKTVLDLLDPLPVLTAVQIELAKQLAESTLNPLAAIIEMMLPSGLSQQADQIFAIQEKKAVEPNRQWTNTQTRILKLLSEKGPLRGRQIDRHFSKVDWRKAAQYLVKSGVLTSQSVLPPPSIRPKFVRKAQLAVPPEQAEAMLPDLGENRGHTGTPPIRLALADARIGGCGCCLGLCRIRLQSCRFTGTGRARVDRPAGDGNLA